MAAWTADSEYDPSLSLDEAVAQRRMQEEKTRIGLNSFLSTSGAMLSPDRQAPGYLKNIPLAGVPESIMGLGGTILNAGSELYNWGKNKWGLNLPDAPGAPAVLDAAGEHFDDTRHGVQKEIEKHTGGVLPAPDPNSTLDQYIDLGMSTLGHAVPVLPSGPVASIVKLVPRGGKTIVQTLLPTSQNVARDAQVAAALVPPQMGIQAGINALNDAETEQGTTTATPAPATTIAPPGATTPAPQAATVPAPDPATVPDSTGVVSDAKGTQIAANVDPTRATDAGLDAYIRTNTRAGPAPAPPPAANDTGLTEALQQSFGGGVSAPAMASTGYSDHTAGVAALELAGAVAAFGIARRIHGTTRVMTDAERTARFNDPEYAAQAADYRNSVIARGGSRVSAGLDPANPPPIPDQNSFRRVSNNLNDQVLNSNARGQEIIRLTADPSEAEALAHQYGNVHNEMRFRTKLGNFLETGRDEETGIQTVSHTGVYRDIGKLDPVRERILMEGLGAANEQNNRTNNLTDWRRANPGVTPTVADLESLRHDFKNQTDAHLTAARTAMMNDPVTADLAQRFKQMNMGMIDLGEAYGFFPSVEAARLRAQHADYVPETGMNGEIMHPFGPRDRTQATGVEQMNTKPWKAMEQHVSELYRQFELNAMNRRIYDSMMDTQRQFPNAAKLLYDVPPPSSAPSYYSGGSFRDPVVAIRTPTGTKFVRTDHPDVLNMLTGGSLLKRRIAMGGLNTMKNWTQYWTTGTGSLATGRIAGIANAGYSIPAMSINMPRNMYGGLLDKQLAKRIGTGPGLGREVARGVARGVDMVTTNLPGAAATYARGLGDRAYGKYLANMLEKGNNNPVNRTLRGYMGDAAVDTMVQSARNHYHNSASYQMEAKYGLGGMGLPVKTELNSLTMPADRYSHSVAAHLVPKAFVNKGAWGSTKATLINLNRIIGEEMGHLSDATHQYAAKLNMDNPNISRHTLTYEIRNMTGDPGVRGSNRYLNAATDVLPYANIGMQGTARFGRAMFENPAMTSVAAATGLLSISLIELLTHMRSHEHMAYFDNTLSTQQHAGKVVLATDDDPNKPTLIPMAQEYQFAHALAKDFASKILNLTALRTDEPWYNAVWDSLNDFFGSHITNANVDSMIHGGVAAFDFLNLPQWAGHIDTSKVLHGDMSPSGIAGNVVNAYRSPVGGQPSALPNQVPDGLLDSKEGRVIENLLKAGLGGLSTVVDMVNNTSRYAKQTGSWLDGLGLAGHDWLQQAKDRNPQLNTLFENALRDSQQSPIEEVTSRELANLHKVTGSRMSLGQEGLTGRGRYDQQVPMSVETKLPTDPTMRAMYNIAGAFERRLAGRETEIAKIKKQMGAVSAQAMDPGEKRKWMNDRTRDVADKYRVIHATLRDLDYALSQMAGRPVSIGMNIDWHGTTAQFAK